MLCVTNNALVLGADNSQRVFYCDSIIESLFILSFFDQVSIPPKSNSPELILPIPQKKRRSRHFFICEMKQSMHLKISLI